MSVSELINKLQKILLNKLNSYWKTELTKELLETLKVIENCTNCENKTYNFNEFHKLINELNEEQTQNFLFDELSNELIFDINKRLNKEILCEDCKEKMIEKITEECGNKKIDRFIYYECKLN